MKTMLFKAITTHIGAWGTTVCYYSTQEKALDYLKTEQNGSVEPVMIDHNSRLNFWEGCTWNELTYGGDIYAVEEDVPEDDGTYWLDLGYETVGHPSQAWSLMKKDPETGESEEVIYKFYKDTPGYPVNEDDDPDWELDVDVAFEAIDAYIKKELGFVPEYEIG